MCGRVVKKLTVAQLSIIPRHLQHTKVYFHAPNSPALDRILSQTNPIRTLRVSLF
jgi:hypothetical protein